MSVFIALRLLWLFSFDLLVLITDLLCLHQFACLFTPVYVTRILNTKKEKK